MSANKKYIVMMQQNNTKQRWLVSPMAYGNDGDIYSDRLLVRDEKATLFDTVNEASNALADTLKKAELDGATWPKNNVFYFFEATVNATTHVENPENPQAEDDKRPAVESRQERVSKTDNRTDKQDARHPFRAHGPAE